MRIKQFLTVTVLAPFAAVGLIVVMFQAGYRCADEYFNEWLDHITGK